MRDGKTFLAVRAQYPRDFCGWIGVHHVGSGRPGAAIHAHVERRIVGVGKAALHVIELQ